MVVCEDQRVKLLVESTEIPTVNQGVETQITSDAQKSGADITRLTEAYIPIEWKGENITSKIRSFDPETQGAYDRCTVVFQNVRDGSWVRVHRGYVRGVSGASTTGVAKVIISDPATMMTAIPFSQTYKKPTIRKVFNDVAEQFSQNTPFTAQVSNVPARNLGADYQSSSDGFWDIKGNTADMINEIQYNINNFDSLDDIINGVEKTFRSNRHSCADALNWATNNGGGKWYFSFRDVGGGLQLVYDNDSQSKTFVQRGSRGAAQEQLLNDGGSFPNVSRHELDVITNDALAELFPINTMTVKGASAASIFGHEVKAIPGKKAPYVTVKYVPLVQRAGGNIVGDTLETSNATLDSAKHTAKKKLEQRILDSGTGQISCYGNPYPRPYDTVIARPECNDVLTSTVKPLPYTVASVKHRKRADSEMVTFIKMSPLVDTDWMTVEKAVMKEV